MREEWPGFFERVPRVVVHDPLSDLLGSPVGGIVEYRYQDAVRLAGHSCPAVASAWLLVLRGLAALYGDDLPQRGGVAVGFPTAVTFGTTGVTASVTGLVTGAAAEGGFSGIRGTFGKRRGLMTFGTGLDGHLSMRRLDTGRGVLLGIASEALPPADPEQRQLLDVALTDPQDVQARTRFQQLWVARVERMLTDEAIRANLVTVVEWE
ncbi:MAG TPA: hypothetical protein PKN52_05305 [Trueperaceae bacterium]|nr:hypothetical protein [Trueperaceae bacterium]